MKKKPWIVVLFALLVIAAVSFTLSSGSAKDAVPQAGNLIANGDFSILEDGQPKGWETGMWVTSAGASYLEAVTLADGTTAALVENAASNDARFEQAVAVRENTTYKLTARVMAEGCGEGTKGANVSFSGIYGTSRDLHDTDGQWETLTLYGRTGKGQKEVTVMVRLGGYGSENTGKAWFTDVRLEQVETVPVGETVLDLATPAPSKKTDTSEPQTARDMSIPLLIGAAVVYLALAAALVRGLTNQRLNARAGLLAVLLGALAIRVLLAFTVEGYGVDMGCFGAWAGKMAAGGPSNFYEAGYFCDYPPAYMLVLWLFGLLGRLLGLGTGSMAFQGWMKLAPIACDLALAAVCFAFAKKRLGEGTALGVAALLALLFFAYVETGDIRLLVSGVLASAASAVNIGVVLAYDYLIAPNTWLGYVLGAVQLAAAGLTAFTAVRLSLGARPLTLPGRRAKPVHMAKESGEKTVCAAEKRERDELLHPQDYRMHLKKRDFAIMGVLTLVYGAVAFYHLGATKAPQTGYVSTAAGETVVLDLGENQEDFHLYYYGGISDTQFTVSTSVDGETYTEEIGAFFDRGECFKWLALREPTYNADGVVAGASGGMLTLNGRYIRLTFDGAGSALWEVAAADGNGRVIPVVSITSSGAIEGRAADPNTLIDEQDTVPEKPTYENSMYFDEIYHARTGYEHAHSLYTYETTHPPLGKVFMSWCIDLMGMTPFAWRFAGTVTGILMIPAIYLLAMQLMKRTRWAALSALLLTADCMYFTQTRIATIDSFPVLFMMVMFLFMARWMQMSFYHQKLWKTLVPLFFSGVFMGLAIASKWIGCYGAVGLAVLFFSRFITLYKQSVYAKRYRNEDPAFARAADSFVQNGAATLAACVVFFVIVPLAIYCLSYIPYLSAYGEVKLNLKTFERIWNAQVTMFEYHKNLVATHYFSSPWYEWPLIIKPMWYYSAAFPAMGKASTIMAFGNPAVWWTGLVAILFVLGYSAYRNALPMLRVTCGRDDAYDRAMPVIAVGFLSAYLPWVLVSRLTFIYHYFASVPFIILATAQGLRYLERHNKKLSHALMLVLGVAAVALFIAFYPYASGLEVSREWLARMNWFKNWMWY